LSDGGREFDSGAYEMNPFFALIAFFLAHVNFCCKHPVLSTMSNQPLNELEEATSELCIH